MGGYHLTIARRRIERYRDESMQGEPRHFPEDASVEDWYGIRIGNPGLLRKYLDSNPNLPALPGDYQPRSASHSVTDFYDPQNPTRDILYISDLNLFHYHQIAKRRRPAIHPIRGVESISQLWVDATPPVGPARANRTTWLRKAIRANYTQQKEIMEVGKGEELIGEKYKRETYNDETKLAVETTGFYDWKTNSFKKAMAKLNVKLVEL